MSSPIRPRQNKPWRETIYADPRRQLLSVRLLLGSRPLESSLEVSLKVSRTVIREGIKQLDLKGRVKPPLFEGGIFWPFGQESGRFLEKHSFPI